MIRQPQSLLVLFFLPILTSLQLEADERVMRLEGKSAQVVVNISGGAIASFHLLEQKLNPRSWQETSNSSGPRWMGHFLCLDRWGPPSEAEERNGMPFHGEASRVEWQILHAPELRDGWIAAE